MKRKLFIESPSFGFGPISTSVNLSYRYMSKFDVRLITSGCALEFLKKNSMNNYINIDTRDKSQFARIFEIASKNDVFISNTNIGFSSFIISNYPNVCIVDTLYWMWNYLPEIYEKHRNFIQQVYYGKYRNNFTHKTICAPIINYNLWSKNKKQCTSKRALITFGGMEEPGDTNYIIAGSNLLIQLLIDELKKHEIHQIDIVGGLLTEQNKIRHKEHIDIKIHGILSPEKMRELVDDSQYVFASPGLTGLYEMINILCPVCVLPGFSVSQIYQVDSLYKELNYPYCITWDISENMITFFDSSSKLESHNYLRFYFKSIENIKSINITNIISKYINDVNSNSAMKHLLDIRHSIFAHPSIDYYLDSFLDNNMI